MKQKYNNLCWPYCGPVVLDGENEIGVVAESLNLSESFEGYFFVLVSMFEMVPQFDPSSIKLVFSDDFIQESLLQSLGIHESAILQADHWHLTHEQWPKFFSSHWLLIQKPMTEMLECGTRIEWEEACNNAVSQVQQYPRLVEYIWEI